MSTMLKWYLLSAAYWAVLLFPAVGTAQSAGAIAGTVRDTTGAVLPGVTVEASSPALIEKARTGTTDAEGQYRIVDLRPGVYAVAFTLSGFATVRREGIELQVGFTAPVNAEMRVGGLEETVMVSGSSPIVDVQNVTQQRVMTRDILDAVPTGKQVFHLAALVPGMAMSGGSGGVGNQDVGGLTASASTRLAIHGGNHGDQQLLVDGYSVNSFSADGGSPRFIGSDSNVQEHILEIAGQSAASETSGVQTNLIPKDGGNKFQGLFSANFMNEHMQSDNYTEELQRQGLRTPNRAKLMWQINPAFGGPVQKGKLWFFSSYQALVIEQYYAGVFQNKNPQGWFYDPDFSRPAASEQSQQGFNVRLTWQATSKDRVTFYHDYNDLCRCRATATSPESAARYYFKTRLTTGTWTSSVSNRLLLQAGVSQYNSPFQLVSQPEAGPYPISDLAGPYAGLLYGNKLLNNENSRITHIKTSLSYVTGTHSTKFGMDLKLGTQERDDIHPTPSYPVQFALLNGVPSRITYYALPTSKTHYLNQPNLGLYAQDQWTARRLTVNAGLRYDWLKISFPDQTTAARPFVPLAYSFPAAAMLNWKDLSPRLGLAYDVFGNGKTAVKWSLGRYVQQMGAGLADEINPVAAVGGDSQTRSWTDNGDFIVQGDPSNFAANGELGPSNNRNFGQPKTTIALDPDYAFGWGARPYNWELSAGVQHELMPRVGLNATYFRRMFGNFEVKNNRAVSPADFETYCVTAPVDPRLPGGGGQPICGLYDIVPTKLGESNILVTTADKFGKQVHQWHGVDVNVQMRPSRALLLQGGFSTGKTMLDTCEVMAQIGYSNPIGRQTQPIATRAESVGNPSTRQCRLEEPFLTSLKALGSYTLPWNIHIGAAFQSNRPPTLLANWTATSAQVRPSLGRNLSTGSSSTVTIPLIEPGTLFGDRVNQLDLRLGKAFNAGGARWEATLDLFNALNASPVLTQNANYGTTGASWLVPTATLIARLAKVSMQVTF